MEDVNERECLDCIAKHPDEIVGVKIRICAQLADNGKNEEEAYRYGVLASPTYLCHSCK